MDISKSEAAGGSVLGIGVTVIMIVQPSFIAELPDSSKVLIWLFGACLILGGLGTVFWPRVFFLRLWGNRNHPMGNEEQPIKSHRPTIVKVDGAPGIKIDNISGPESMDGVTVSNSPNAQVSNVHQFSNNYGTVSITHSSESIESLDDAMKRIAQLEERLKSAEPRRLTTEQIRIIADHLAKHTIGRQAVELSYSITCSDGAGYIQQFSEAFTRSGKWDFVMAIVPPGNDSGSGVTASVLDMKNMNDTDRAFLGALDAAGIKYELARSFFSGQTVGLYIYEKPK